MAVLSNARHERFAQEIAKGHGIAEAYELAGYNYSPAGASRLLKKINFRVEEIKSQANQQAIDALALTKEKVLAELARIGFADIRKAVEWHGTLVQESDNPDGGDTLVIKNIFSNHVRLIGSDEIDADTAAAIAEVKQSPTGGLSIKFHDKQAALVNLGRHLGLFVDKHEITGKDGGPIQVIDAARQRFFDRIDTLRKRIEGRVDGLAITSGANRTPEGVG